MSTRYYIAHEGIKGQKWGVRRFQNEDGTLTEAGKERYSKNYNGQQRTRDRRIYGPNAVERINKRMLNGESIQSARNAEVKIKRTKESGKAIGKNIAKAALIVSGAAAVAILLKKKGIGGGVATDILTEQVVNVGRQVVNSIFK